MPTPAARAEPDPITLDDLVAAASRLVTPPTRRILGITGAPGAGKSTVAEALVAALAPHAVLVGMDGFHLRDDELRRLGRYERKGARDTFDPAGYVHLLRRLRAGEDAVVYAPVFDRELEESIGSAVPVAREVPLIITEGNYLLVDDEDWGEVAGLLDECWFLEPAEEVRIERLVARHMRYGRVEAEALHRTHGSDGRNAELTASYRDRASWVVCVQ